MFSIMDTAAEVPAGRAKTSADRACDQCKARKVRCDMKRPCVVCASKDFDCTYEKARKKRGPMGKRIQEIRVAQAKANGESYQQVEVEDGWSPPSNEGGMGLQHATLSNGTMDAELGNLVPNEPYWPQVGLPQSPRHDDKSLQRVQSSTFSDASRTIPPLDPMLASPTATEFVFPSLPMDSPSSSWDPFGAILQQEIPQVTANIDIWPSHINEETLLPWIDVYFKRLHPTIPILDRAEMYREMLGRKHRTNSQYGAMLLGLCAFAMTQPIQIHERGSTPSRAVQARMLMEECVRMRVAPDFGEHPSIEMILASFFLFACLFGNGQHKAARHKLREAVDLAYSLGIHSPSNFATLDSGSKERYLRTFLVLSVTERAYALQQRHPIDFRGRPGMSAHFMQDFDPNDATAYITRLMYADQSDTMAMTGLMYLMDTFDAIDERVVECWIGYCRYSDGACELFDRRRALRTLKALRRARECASEGNVSFAPSVSQIPLAKLPESQRADISITQLWLLNRLWHLCLTHNLLRQSSEHLELNYQFACDIAKAVLTACNSLSLSAMEVHGIGFAEKVFDTAMGVVLAVQTSSGTLGLRTRLSSSVDDIILAANGVSNDEYSVEELFEGLRVFLQTFRGGDHPYKTRFEDAHQELVAKGG